jgi:hypothetical protein
MAILGLVILLLGVGSLVTRNFAGVLQDFPLYLEKIRDRVSFLSGPLEEVSQASKQVEQMMGAEPEFHLAGSSQAATLVADPLQSNAGLRNQVSHRGGPELFPPGSRRVFPAQDGKGGPTFQDKRRIVEIAREIEWSISRYLASVTLLNLGLGLWGGVRRPDWTSQSVAVGRSRLPAQLHPIHWFRLRNHSNCHCFIHSV